MWRDFRYSLRMLLKSKAVTLVCIVSMALCIGAITSVYSVIEGVLLRPFPYANSDQLAVLWNNYPGLEHASISPAEFADYREMFTSASEIAAFTDANRNLTGLGEPERLQAFLVSPNLFHLLGVRPLIGRDFVSGDGVDGKNQFVLMSHDLWKRRFGLDPSIIGKTIDLDSKPYVVLGVLPENIRFPEAPAFQFPERPDVWIPFSWEQLRNTQPRGDQFLRVIARLRVSREKANAELEAIRLSMRKAFPDRYTPRWKPLLVSFRDHVVGDIQQSLWILFASAGLVLLIACTNVAHMKLAQSADRCRENSVRIALGAGRGEIFRQYLIEGLLLSLISGAIGSLLAVWAVKMTLSLAPPEIPRIQTIGINLHVLLFSICVSFVAGIIFGIIPALQRTGIENLKNQVTTMIHHRYQKVLMTMEVALAIVVLIAACLLFKSFRALQRIDPGWKAEKVLTFYVPLPRDKYDNARSLSTFYETLFSRIRSLPGTTSAGAIYPLPLCGDTWSGSFDIENQPVPSGQPQPHASLAVTSGDPFQSLSIRLLEGRNFLRSEIRGVPPVAIVDEDFARKYWPGQSAVGKRLDIIGAKPVIWTTIVGVVSHIRTANLMERGEPQLYMPAFQVLQRSSFVTVRTSATPGSVIAATRDIVRSMDPNQPLAKIHPMQDLLDQAVARQRFQLRLLSLFALTALVLAATGIYGIMSYAVQQRTREIGLRMALGAGRVQVQSLILKSAVYFAIIGMFCGTVTVLMVGKVLTSLLYEISSSDPIAIFFAWMMVGVITFFASYIPARRASGIDPAITLRYE